MDRSNHYEAAFEAYLQWHRLCYVAVDETRRAMLGEAPVKSLDFIVYGGRAAACWWTSRAAASRPGRRASRAASGSAGPRAEDVDGLERWAELFGPGYQGLLVFTYHLLPTVDLPDDTDDLWTWRGRRYLFRAVPAADYRRHMRVRSPPLGDRRRCRTPVFRDLVRPFHHFTRCAVRCPSRIVLLKVISHELT